MRSSVLLIAAILAAAAPLAESAESAVGGSYLWRTNETGGPFEGSGSGGYKIFLGTYRSTAGAEIAFINFGKIGGGDGPHAQAWASGMNLGIPIWKLQTYVKAGLARSRVSGTAITEESNHYRLYYGGGVRMGQQKGFGLRAEYERFKLDSDTLEVFSGGVEYLF
jgi:hypothetical protein